LPYHLRHACVGQRIDRVICLLSQCGNYLHVIEDFCGLTHVTQPIMTGLAELGENGIVYM